MSRVPMGSDGGAWAMDPETNYDTSLRPAGHRRRPDRHDRGASPARTSTPTPRARRSAPPPRRPRAASPDSVVPVQGPQRPGRARPRRVHPPGHHGRDARQAQAVVRGDGRDGRLRRRRAAEVPLGREDQPRPHAGQLVGHRRRRRRWWRSATSRPATSSACTPRARILATAVSRRRPDDHAHRPRAGRPARRWPRPA